MFTLLTVIRKKPEVTSEEFRRFMEFDYGPTYSEMPETRSYVQYFLTDLAQDGADPAIDAIVQISFDSESEMRKALQSESYKRAHDLRGRFMQDTSVGIHSAVVDKIVKLVGG